MEHRIALAQASCLAGEAILERLAATDIPPDWLVLLDHESKRGKRLRYRERFIVLQDQHSFDLSSCAVLLMPEADPRLETAAMEQGCLLLSHAIERNTASHFLMSAEDDLEIDYGATSLRLAGEELCCLLPSLMGLESVQGIADLGITLVRSAEFHGHNGIAELASQTVDLLNARDAKSEVYPEQIAFNILPELTAPNISEDLRYFIGNNSFSLALQTLNVPVFHGFAAAVQIRFNAEVELAICGRRLKSIQNTHLKAGIISSVSDCNQSFSCVISHLEQPPKQPSNLLFWIIADPMRYGLANNYVNVLESLLKSFL